MATPLEYADVDTPIGTFRVVYQGSTVRVLDLLEKGVRQSGIPPGAIRRRAPFGKETPPRQVSEYFRGSRTEFQVDVDPDTVSRFDRAVWKTLRAVPQGRTVTYGELARRSGYAGSARAVGGAMARNPIPIIIPCHRVVGTGGAITGFGLGLWRKRWLLDHEGAWPIRSRSAEGPSHRDQRTLDAGWAGRATPSTEPTTPRVSSSPQPT